MTCRRHLPSVDRTAHLIMRHSPGIVPYFLR